MSLHGGPVWSDETAQLQQQRPHEAWLGRSEPRALLQHNWTPPLEAVSGTGLQAAAWGADQHAPDMLESFLTSLNQSAPATQALTPGPDKAFLHSQLQCDSALPYLAAATPTPGGTPLGTPRGAARPSPWGPLEPLVHEAAASPMTDALSEARRGNLLGSPGVLQEGGAVIDAQIRRLQGTLQHYRSWAAQLQTRYQAFNPDAIRPARRIYIGGLPPTTTDVRLRQFINELMIRAGGAVSAGYPITSCKVYMDKAYSFLEFRTVEEASNAMALDGVLLDDAYLKVRRPNNYDQDVAMLLGPTEPDPTMDLEGLEMIRTVVADSPNKLFVGGLPCDWSEEQVKDLLTCSFGRLRAFNLVMDKSTGNSKGYAFCEYQDINVTNVVIDKLNLKPVGSKVLTVKRALSNAPYPSISTAAASALPFQMPMSSLSLEDLVAGTLNLS